MIQRIQLLAIVAAAYMLSSIGFIGLQVRAADEPPTSAAAESIEISRWIEQLDADQFAQRSEANKRLEEAGKQACPQLADTAIGGSREARLRAIEILRKHIEDGDEDTQAAAKQALERIAQSDQPASAQRAKEILNPKPAAPAGIPGFGIVPGQIQIQINAIGGRQARRVQINNGVKQIEVDDNGTKVKITDDPNKGIRVETTEKKEGKEQTKQYSAKNADELKKKHPEAYRLYEKYGKQQAIQFRAIQLQPGAARPIPILPQRGAAARPALKTGASTMLKSAERLVQSSIKQLERLKDSPEGNPDDVDKSVQRLKEIAKQLQEERTRWEQ
jgi:hypothetical protein